MKNSTNKLGPDYLIKSSNLDLLAILYRNGVRISAEATDIIIGKDVNKKLFFLNQNDSFIEILLSTREPAALLLIRRFMKIGWSKLRIVLNKMAQDNPYLVLHLLEDNGIKELCKRNSDELVEKVRRKAQERMQNILARTEKYEKTLRKYGD